MLILSVAVSVPAGGSPVAPTFNSEVAPILYRRCVGCHRQEGSAAQSSLTTFDRTRRLGSAIKKTTGSRSMPPWPADAERSIPFANDARLSQREIDILAAWVDAGMPQGSGAPPALPAESSTWSHPKHLPPDVVIALPEVVVPANGEMDYVIQRVKVPLAADKWINAMQVRPGAAAVIHHMGITEITLGAGVSGDDEQVFATLARRLGAAPDAFDSSVPTVTDSANEDAYDMLGIYTPGTAYEGYSYDTGKLLKAGPSNYINFNVHYTTIGVETRDRSELGLWFAQRPPAHQLIRSPAAVETIIANSRQLLTDDPGTPAEGTSVAIPPIQPYERNYEIIGMTAYTQPVTLYQFQPHAHMRAKDFTYTVVHPDGREQSVLAIPRYDFHWQLAYEVQTPLTIAAGSKLVVTAHYDNSARNSNLRNLGSGSLAKNCGPDKVAYFRRQNQSWNEMFSPIVQYSMGRTHGADRAMLVEVTGCLSGGVAESAPQVSAIWRLVSASKAVATNTQSTSASEIAAHSAWPLGKGNYELVGARFFQPERFADRKVIVKGVVSKAVTGRRLNVTSLQETGTCPAR